MKIYYFGRDLHPACPGHRYIPATPVGISAPARLHLPVDGGYAPDDRNQVEGRAKVTHEGETLTILSFWDRSGDPRLNSASTFILIGSPQVEFEEAMVLIRNAFPKFIARAEARFKIEEAR